MDKNYICSRCKKVGGKNTNPYKIIKETVANDGSFIKFMGQLCENCYKELFQEDEQKKETAE